MTPVNITKRKTQPSCAETDLHDSRNGGSQFVTLINQNSFIPHELNGFPPFTFLQSNTILIISSIYPDHWHCPRHVTHRHLWFIRTVNCYITKGWNVRYRCTRTSRHYCTSHTVSWATGCDILLLISKYSTTCLCDTVWAHCFQNEFIPL